MSGADQAVGAPERLHPLYLVTGLGRGVRQTVSGSVALAYLAVTDRWQLALLLLSGIAIVLVVGVVLYWRRFEYRVGANDIRIDSGILNRTHRSIPFDRIQDVDISQGPLARLLGLARVKFETGASAGDDADDGTLAAIALSRAEALRQHVRSRRTMGTGPVATAEDESTPLFAMDLRRVLVAGVFNFSLTIIAALFGATQTFGDVAGIDFFARSFWRDALEVGTPLANLVLAHKLIAVLAGTLMLVAIGLVTGIGRTLLRDYRFRLDRTATGLRRRRGLLTLTDVSLPIRRVQAAIIGSGPVRDRLGWRDLKLQSLASDEGSQCDHLVAPLARDAEIEAILCAIGWRPVAAALARQPVAPAYAWGFTWSVSLLFVPAIVQMLWRPWVGAVFCLVIFALIAARWLAWRRFRYALDGDRLLVWSGWWKRRTIILPLSSIQSVDVTETLVSRRFGTAALTIGVASGRGYSGHGIPALPRATADALRATLLARFA